MPRRSPVSLLLCRTCPRYTAGQGQFAGAVRDSLEAIARRDGFELRQVNCLGGCLAPGNVGLDGPVARVRISQVTPADLEAVAAARRRYQHNGLDAAIELLRDTPGVAVTAVAPRVVPGGKANCEPARGDEP